MPICPELMSYAVLRPGPNGSMEMINGRCTPAESAFHLSSSRTSYSTAHFPIQYRTWHHQCLFIHSNTCLFQSSRSLPQGNTPWLSLYTQGRWQGFRPHSPTQVLSLKGLGEVSSLSLSLGQPHGWLDHHHHRHHVQHLLSSAPLFLNALNLDQHWIIFHIVRNAANANRH